MTSARSYAYGVHRRVNGWLEPVSARVVYHLARWQTSRGIQGGVGEIGVHQGRFFLLLHLLMAEGERSFAIDVFDSQHLNVDRSGRGDLDAFLSNVRRYSGSTADVAVLKASSQDISAQDIVDAVGSVRLMSIDGGHTAEVTENDLHLADAVLSRDGVAVLDDMLSYRWPGVLSGALNFFGASDQLVPVGLIPNKTLLVRPERVDEYLRALDDIPAGFRSSREELLGHPVVVVRGYSRGWRGLAERAYGWASRRPVISRVARILRQRVTARR